MAHFAASILSRSLLRAGALLCLVLGSACSTLHEADLAANRGYNEFGTPSYKPSLASPNAKTRSGASANSSRSVARLPSKAQYSPMVERTVSGVKVVQGFSAQAAKAKPKTVSGQATQAARAQQNSKLTKSYNAGNLLDR